MSPPPRRDSPPLGDEPGPQDDLLWGVGAVSSMLGIATPTLRTWDRRYQLGPSQRTAGGHRRYSQVDIARVDLMSQLVDQGVPAQQAATVALNSDDADLRTHTTVPALLRSARATATSSAAVAPIPRARTTGATVSSIMAAAEAMDSVSLAKHLSQVFEQRGIVSGWSDVVVPLLITVGDRWRRGEVGVEVEHLVAESIATELRGIVRASRVRRSTSRPVLLASAPEEQHMLPLLALEAVLAEQRVLTIGLGARTTPHALSNAVAICDPRAVVVWASMPRHPSIAWLTPWPHSEAGRRLVLAGPGWPQSSMPESEGLEVLRVNDLHSALTALEAA
jgi:DNA-binding transcriptional MerR regulator/type IV secretory pathway TrbD component